MDGPNNCKERRFAARATSTTSNQKGILQIQAEIAQHISAHLRWLDSRRLSTTMWNTLQGSRVKVRSSHIQFRR